MRFELKKFNPMFVQVFLKLRFGLNNLKHYVDKIFEYKSTVNYRKQTWIGFQSNYQTTLSTVE